VLRALKVFAFRAAEAAGLTSLLLHSSWRRHRLLVLCYHGLSLDDEHLWSPAVYLPPELFRARIETLRDLRCAVLPLAEALDRLREGRLPPRAVSITFDDGNYDFYKLAWPILRGYGFPATVYLTTYYALYNRPVFDPMLSYLLWKGGNRRLDWPEFFESPLELDVPGRAAAVRRIEEQARGLSAAGKDALLACLAARLGVDYEALCARRLLQIMNLDEVRELAGAGLDVQLHTHRHRIPPDRELFLHDLEDNRRTIAAASEAPAVHFCYPCGRCAPEFFPWLRLAGVQSAATCFAGLAAARTDPYLLPRVLDTATMSAAEYRAWVSGLAALLPRRRRSLS
jgi:peptidoglycan/xylan/chitin deacetylase (PgdA/CDA1 family)